MTFFFLINSLLKKIVSLHNNSAHSLDTVTMLYATINLIFIVFLNIWPLDLTGRGLPHLSFQEGNSYEIIRSLTTFLYMAEALKTLKELDGHTRTKSKVLLLL